MSTSRGDQRLFAVVGISPDQATDLLFQMDEAPVSEEAERIERRQLGDFGLGALVFVATAGTIASILRWVGNQQDDVCVKLKFLSLFEIEVKKTTTLNDVKKFAAKNGVTIG